MKIELEITPIIQKMANVIARQFGYGMATTIIIDDELKEPVILARTDKGYRKYTTGEYVPNSYLNNFGWKNTYYQHALTTVGIPYDYIQSPLY